MKSAGGTVRADQIGALTLGLQLPLPAVDSVHLEFIAEGLSRAFAEVSAEHPGVVAQGSEAEITAMLEVRLNALVSQDPFWGQLVLCAVRGKESVSFDGSHIEKRPDLSIFLSSRTRNFPLIVEAKILDASTSKTLALYCKNGLARFLVGDYAWASQEAFMLAYVRDAGTIAGKLTPLLSKDMAHASPSYAVQVLPTPSIGFSGSLAWSQHLRTFGYIHQASTTCSPGPIKVWHLWLPQ
jgi:hypothetical protein